MYIKEKSLRLRKKYGLSVLCVKAILRMHRHGVLAWEISGHFDIHISSIRKILEDIECLSLLQKSVHEMLAESDHEIYWINPDLEDAERLKFIKSLYLAKLGQVKDPYEIEKMLKALKIQT